MPTQLWVRAPVPGPLMVCHPVRGPGLGGAFPLLEGGPVWSHRSREELEGLWEQSPALSFVSSQRVPSPSKHTHTWLTPSPRTLL